MNLGNMDLERTTKLLERSRRSAKLSWFRLAGSVLVFTIVALAVPAVCGWVQDLNGLVTIVKPRVSFVDPSALGTFFAIVRKHTFLYISDSNTWNLVKVTPVYSHIFVLLSRANTIVLIECDKSLIKTAIIGVSLVGLVYLYNSFIYILLFIFVFIL